MKLTPLQRLENTLTVDENGCWISSIGESGEDKHTRFKIGRQKVRAHRYMYEQKVGPIAENQRIYHTCSNQKCCNPDHLIVKDVKSKEERDAERGPPVTPLPPIDRLKRSITANENGCWISSLGAEGGYSKVKDGNKDARGHRLMYAHTYGEIPDGLFVCHKCDTPKCVNPEHLFLGTASDNVQDMHAKGRARGGKKRVNKDEIVAAHKADANKPIVELAEELGYHHSAVYKVLQKAGLRVAAYKHKEKHQLVIDLITENPLRSVKETAKLAGCADTTVDRVIQKYKINRREIQKDVLQCSHYNERKNHERINGSQRQNAPRGFEVPPRGSGEKEVVDK